MEKVVTIKHRLSALESRLAPARECPLIILHDGELPTPEQAAQIERAEKHNMPILIIKLGSARYGK